MTTVVRGGTVVTPARTGKADIVIDDGRITAIVPPGTASADELTLDATGLLVLPGMVDAHVHFQEPGRTDWEGFDTGSAAAAAGGVTTVVDMPIDCDPPTITAAAVDAKADAITRNSRVDVAIWGGLVPESLAQLAEMAAQGVCGFKAFACPSGWDDFPAAGEATLAAGFAAAARLRLPVAVHCELEGLGHSVESEVEAVRLAASLAADAQARLHVVHVSAAEAVDEARRWPDVTVETCPHYLFLTDADASVVGADAHCFPPIRDRDNRAQLWQRVKDGSIDCIASDHSPCPPNLKAGPTPWAGIDGVGLTLPMLLSEDRLTLSEVVRLTTAAARILRLPGKGSIEIGSDADLAVVDPDLAWEAHTLSRYGRSPFNGRLLRGRVVTTVVRGRVVFTLEGGVSATGGGRVVRPRSEDRRSPGGDRRSY